MQPALGARLTVDADRKAFYQALHTLSVVCRFDFDEEGAVPAAYERALSPLGLDRVNGALRKIFEERRSTDPFPSVREIKAVLDESLSPEDQAPLIAGKILEAIARIGPYQTAGFRASVGEVGWRIVQMSGGVEQVCMIEDRDIAAHRSQWAKLAMSLLRAGAAALPPPPQPNPPKIENKQELKSLAHIFERMPK